MSDETSKPAVMNNLNQEVETRTQSVVEMIEKHIAYDGLVPEIGERSKGEVYDSKNKRWLRYDSETMRDVEVQYGFNTELLGYSLRLAVESGNRELFERLQSSLDELKTQEGLLVARLHPDRTQDMEAGSSWADANQDIALAYIEAGEVWRIPEYTERGMALAEVFARSSHIKRLENGVVIVFNTPEMAASATLGDRIEAVDLSMLNLKLYSKMIELSDNELWRDLEHSGEILYKKALESNSLPPSRLFLVDGDVVQLDLIKQNETLLNTIPSEDVRTYLKEYRPEWDWDSMRTPFRLNDCNQVWAHKISEELYVRLLKLGGSKTHIYADTGEAHPQGEKMASTVAPMLTSIARKEGWKKALMELYDSEKEHEKSVMYMQLWQGLAVQQLQREVPEV